MTVETQKHLEGVRRFEQSIDAALGNRDSLTGALGRIAMLPDLHERHQRPRRARRQGDWLVIYHKRLDDYLAERKTRWAETEAKRKAELAVEQEKLAPVSVEGF